MLLDGRGLGGIRCRLCLRCFSHFPPHGLLVKVAQVLKVGLADLVFVLLRRLCRLDRLSVDASETEEVALELLKGALKVCPHTVLEDVCKVLFQELHGLQKRAARLGARLLSEEGSDVLPLLGLHVNVADAVEHVSTVWDQVGVHLLVELLNEHEPVVLKLISLEVHQSRRKDDSDIMRQLVHCVPFVILEEERVLLAVLGHL